MASDVENLCACDFECGCTTTNVFRQGHDERVRRIMERDERGDPNECHDPDRCKRVDWCRIPSTWWEGKHREQIERHRRANNCVEEGMPNAATD